MFKFQLWRRASIHLGIVSIVLTLFPLLVGYPQIVLAQATDSTSFQPELTAGDSMLVGVDLDMARASSAQDMAAWFDAQGWTLERYWPAWHLAQVRVSPVVTSAHMRDATGDDGAMTERAALLRTNAHVRFVAPDMPIQSADFSGVPDTAAELDFPEAELSPSDPLFAFQWAATQLRIADAWTITHGDPAVTVALIDSGYGVDHEDIGSDSVWNNPREVNGLPGIDDDANGYVDDLHGWDWIDDDNAPTDPFGHGTHVGGVIAATTDNQLGVAGLGRNLKVLPLRVLDEEGSGRLSDLISALDYVRASGVRIVNLSLVLQADSPALADVIEQLHADGVLVVAAAGNLSSAVFWPAAYPTVVAVTATDANDRRSSFSNFGVEVDLAAPGVEIMSTFRDQNYQALSGTSMATAHVSALAGLAWSLRPDLDPDQLLALLQSGVVDVNHTQLPGADIYLGAGRIDFATTLRTASAGLELVVADGAQSVAVVSDPGTVALLARTVATQEGVAGAVIHHQVVAVDDTSDETTSEVTPPVGTSQPATSAVISRGRTVTDSTGQAVIEFAAPDRLCSCFLRLQLGEVTYTMPIQVSGRPAAVAIRGTEDLITTDTTLTNLRVEIADSTGALVTNSMPVHLSTTRGTFANGARTIDVTAEAGVVIVPFRPGRQSGVATLTAQAANLQSEQEIWVHPGAATTIIGPTAADTPLALAGEPLELLFVVTDAHGNLVVDGTVARCTVTGATAAAGHVSTHAGVVKVVLLETDPQQEIVGEVWIPASEAALEWRLARSLHSLHLPFLTTR